MNATLSLLGTVMLILVGVAVVLAVLILILYEARWIVRLGKQLSRSISAADEAGAGSEPLRNEHGGL
jgi:Na+-transporting methylmalonyl-CoA/oxaloacetate decarboxylase gamma subunit